MASAVLPMPSFEQAKAYALKLGITTEEQWQEYLVGMSREELYRGVVATATNGSVTDAILED